MRLWEQMPALVAPAGPGLYYGSAGIAVFLAEAGRVLGDGNLLDLARRALQPTRTILHHGGAARLAGGLGAGYARGLGGIIAALCWCADLLDDRSLVEDALILSRATPQALAASRVVSDMMEGAAGLAIGLGVLAGAGRGEEGVREAMAICGRALCATSRMLGSGRRHWPERQRIGQSGLSHGAAGMAAALVHVWRVTGEPAFRDAALEATAHEDAVFGSEDETRLPLHPRFSHQKRSSWCHGAPGIALARAMMRDALGAPAAPLAPTLDLALEGTRGTPIAGADDLCCGEAGRLEILCVLGTRLGRRDLIEEAQSALATRLCDWGRGEARFLASAAPRAPDDAALFRGWAGIGHLLVRHMAPGMARDVLLPWAT